MESNPDQSTPEDFALMRGGPLHRLVQRAHVEKPGHPVLSAGEKALLGWLLTWLPLAILCVAAGDNQAFLADRTIQAEFLFALPTLLAGEAYVSGRVADAVRRPLLLELLSAADLDRYRKRLAMAARWRDRNWAEAIILVVSWGFSLVQFGYGRRVPPFALHGGRLTAAGVWYAVVAYPLFWFVVLRWCWRFLIWWDVLLHLSRLDLRLIPTHADKNGGLRFLANCQASFGVLVFALGCVVSTLYPFGKFTLSEGGLFAYARDQLAFAVVALFIVNLPLLLFCRKLLEARRAADARFSALIARHARAFERKWFGERERESPLGDNDMCTQIDSTSSFIEASRMRWLPCGLRPTVSLVLAGFVLPLVPRLIYDRQLIELLTQLLSKAV